MSTRIRVVLSCDTANEIDDQFAIAYALGCDDLEVVGVVSVQNTIASGENSIELYQEEAERVVRLAGAANSVPCIKGASVPMKDDRTPIESEGLDFLIEAATSGPLVILATGPATDVASLCLAAPELRQKIDIVWAGGFPDAETWDRKKFGELNARADIAAWRRLTMSEGPLKILPGWPGVEMLTVDHREFAQKLRSKNSDIANYLARILDTWIGAHPDSADMDQVGEGRNKVLWDIANIAAVHRPESVRFTVSPLPSIDPAGYPNWKTPVRSADIGLDINAPMIIDDFWRALSRLPHTNS